MQSNPARMKVELAVNPVKVVVNCFDGLTVLLVPKKQTMPDLLFRKFLMRFRNSFYLV